MKIKDKVDIREPRSIKRLLKVRITFSISFHFEYLPWHFPSLIYIFIYLTIFYTEPGILHFVYTADV